MVWAPTTDQILDLEGVRRRSDAFRFELNDKDHRPIGELHPDREQSIPSIQNDTSNNTSRRLSGLKLTPDEAADVNPLSDRLRVYMVLQNDVEYLLGTFTWGDENKPMRSWGDEHHGDLVDYTFFLDQETTRAFGWGRGGTINLIMYYLFFQTGFEFNDIAVIGDAANRGLADPMSWQPGTRWLQMQVDLGNLVGFASPYLNRYGRIIADEPPDPAFTTPTIPAYDAGTRVIADSIVTSNELLSAPNEFGVFDSGTDRLRTGRYHLPASAPHSFQNRGFRMGRALSVQGLASQMQADKTARNFARNSDVYEYVAFSSTLDPRHDTYDVIDAFGKRWLEVSWTMELRSGGLMQHVLKRVNYDVT